MGYLDNLLGQKFGRLTVIEEIKERTKGRQVRWICICDCGKVKEIGANNLRRGTTKSCGCLSAELAATRNTKHGQNIKGKTTSEYNAWSNMKDRCYNENYREFYLYGGRGIEVCDTWRYSFEIFFADMGMKPTPKHSLDRYPDTNGNYEPSNCRWATIKQQAGNTRSNKWIEFNGMKMIQADWAEYLGTTPQTLWGVLKKKTFEDVYNFYINTIDKKEATRKLIADKNRAISKEVINQIRQDYISGIKQSVITKKYKIGKQVICRIVHNKAYKYD